MKKDVKVTQEDKMENQRPDETIQNQMSKATDNIKDFDRAWEDDRL